MVSQQSIDKQLKRIGFKKHSWGRGEVEELKNIILPDEEIYECVNGIYEGGFALLLATDVRVLLVDKKPLNYLTVEDLRFEMINELDYSHRLLGAQISIASGSKTLRFRSYNQPRLRKLITHVQHCMAEAKKKESNHQEDQKIHLEQINKQLQEYLLAQQEQLKQLQTTRQIDQETTPLPPVRPSNELSDYLLAQSLLTQHQQLAAAGPATASPPQPIAAPSVTQELPTAPAAQQAGQDSQLDEIYNDGIQEVFGKHQPAAADSGDASQEPEQPLTGQVIDALQTPVHPMNIAYSKLPMALRSRKFGRRSWSPTP